MLLTLCVDFFKVTTIGLIGSALKHTFGCALMRRSIPVETHVGGRTMAHIREIRDGWQAVWIHPTRDPEYLLSPEGRQEPVHTRLPRAIRGALQKACTAWSRACKLAYDDLSNRLEYQWGLERSRYQEKSEWAAFEMMLNGVVLSSSAGLVRRNGDEYVDVEGNPVKEVNNLRVGKYLTDSEREVWSKHFEEWKLIPLFVSQVGK